MTSMRDLTSTLTGVIGCPTWDNLVRSLLRFCLTITYRNLRQSTEGETICSELTMFDER